MPNTEIISCSNKSSNNPPSNSKGSKKAINIDQQRSKSKEEDGHKHELQAATLIDRF